MDTLLKNTRDWLQTSTRRSFSAVLEEAKITPRQVEICKRLDQLSDSYAVKRICQNGRQGT